MNNTKKLLLADELFALNRQKKELCDRIGEIETILDANMENGETLLVDAAAHYLKKVVSDVPVLVDSKTVAKQIGTANFLKVAKASVQKLRDLVGEEKFVKKFVKQYKQSTAFKFYETGPDYEG